MQSRVFLQHSVPTATITFCTWCLCIIQRTVSQSITILEKYVVLQRIFLPFFYVLKIEIGITSQVLWNFHILYFEKQALYISSLNITITIYLNSFSPVRNSGYVHCHIAYTCNKCWLVHGINSKDVYNIIKDNHLILWWHQFT